jgi:endonuclease YncB( thermonuclease family)
MRMMAFHLYLLLAATAPAAAADLVGPATVVDGDTIDIGDDRIRLWGIDAPERHAPGGPEASAWLAALLDGRTVRCVDTGGRSYERIVAQCFLADTGEDLAWLLIDAGHAVDWPRYSGGHYSRR